MKFRLVFMDGTEEIVEGWGVWVTSIIGRVKARQKNTYLFGIFPLDKEAEEEIKRRTIIPEPVKRVVKT